MAGSRDVLDEHMAGTGGRVPRTGGAELQCFHLIDEPPIRIQAPGEDGGETGRFIGFPLGVACTFDVAGDGIPPQTLWYINWSSTFALILLCQAAGAGLIAFLVPAGFGGTPS